MPPLPPRSPCVGVNVEATTFVFQGEVARWKVEEDQYNSDWRSITQNGAVELLCLPSGVFSTVLMRRTCSDNYCPGHTPWGADEFGNGGHVEFRTTVDGCVYEDAQPSSYFEASSFIDVNCGRRLEQPGLAPELTTATGAPIAATDPDPAPDPGSVVDEPNTRGQPAPLVPSLEQVMRRRLVDASWVLLNTTSAWLGLSHSTPHLLLGQLVERSFARDDVPLINTEVAALGAARRGAAAAARLQQRRRLQQTGLGPGSDLYNSYGCYRVEQQTEELDNSGEWEPRVAYEAVGGDGNVFSEQGLKEMCAVHEAFHLGPKSHLFCRRDYSSSSDSSSNDAGGGVGGVGDLTALCVIKSR